MQKQRRWLTVLLVLGALFAWSSPAVAQTLHNDENFFGSGGELEACSSNYCAKQSLGETAVGRSDSTNYSAQSGFNTTDAPFLEMNVNGTNIDLGELTPAATTTTSATFWVRAYLASGYVIMTRSDPPNNNGHFITNLTTPTAPAAGTEQFGINLVANTDPVNFGADPDQVPDPTYGFGYAAADYDTPDVYKYVKGDVIAASDSSSGRTNYTISYIYNINNITPGGTFTFNHDLVAVATY